jgi:hypothetical protein
MGGGCAYGAMPKKAVPAMLFYKEFSHLYGLVFVIGGAMHVTAMSKRSWH